MKYNCPVCNGELKQMFGESLHPNDKNYGVTVYCSNIECPSAEVSGHGNNAAHAFEIVTQKFNRRK